MKAIKNVASTVLRVLIADLPCHVVTLHVVIRVIQAILKYKTDAYIKEFIMLDILPMFNFTTYYDPSPTLWEVVANSMSSFYQFRN